MSETYLSDEEKRQLLAIARSAVRSAVARAGYIPPAPPQGRLHDCGAAFVTLHLDGELRGCIGTLAATEPLYRVVASVAVSAAMRDPRFRPPTAAELDHIDLEISVLTPRRLVSDPAEIQPGRDGLVVTFGSRSGLLLPQVATEYGWGRDEFLRHTCMKAGLPPDTWQDPRCRIEAFSAEVFGEAELSS